MRSILLHVQDDGCLEARLQVALDIARAFGGHVTCQQSLALAAVVASDLYVDMAAEMVPVLRERAEALRLRIEPRMEVEDVTWDWSLSDDTDYFAIPAEAQLNDLIVMGACDQVTGRPAYSSLAADVIARARTPVLLVPADCQGFDVSAPVAVAWNGADEAARALRAALPLLARAGSVELLTVSDDSVQPQAQFPPTRAESYLARHGIACRLTELPLGGGSIAMRLTQAARAREAACLVMGAYGHSRLRETIVGGVTRELMRDPPMPLFLMH